MTFEWSGTCGCDRFEDEGAAAATLARATTRRRYAREALDKYTDFGQKKGAHGSDLDDVPVIRLRFWPRSRSVMSPRPGGSRRDPEHRHRDRNRSLINGISPNPEPRAPLFGPDSGGCKVGPSMGDTRGWHPTKDSLLETPKAPNQFGNCNIGSPPRLEHIPSLNTRFGANHDRAATKRRLQSTAPLQGKSQRP